MSSERLAIMAATKVRDLLRPVMPVVNIQGKQGKIKPVVFIQYSEGQRTVLWAVPEGTKVPEIPEELYKIPIKQKTWEGPAPQDIQKLGMQLFGVKKK
ncbi:MAG: hypothetical protein KF802_16370 [Bdellovibrionaceae bacterium]|nr:hypothetical protein [Pseudobdellovibrionaceae bacterium]